MSVRQLGGGFAVSGYPALPNSLSGANAQTFSGVCDADGVITVAVANADTKQGVCTFQESAGSQGGFQRIDPSNTTQIKFRADIEAEAEGLTAAGFYWEA